MLCFRDRTYCRSPNCTNECGRKLTQEILDAADRVDMPVSTSYFCGSPEDEDED